MRTQGIIWLLALALPIAGCRKEGCTDSTSYNYDPDADKDNGDCLDMAGCLGFRSGYSNSGSLGNSLGDPGLNQAFYSEVNYQQNFFSALPASVYVWYEPNGLRNALSTSDRRILFGYNMFHYTLQYYNGLAVSGVLAHEWAHQAQFTFGWSQQGTLKNELEADAFAGYYMAFMPQYLWSQIQGYYANVYASGDYLFNDPGHHGTPNQRLAAAYLGVTTAVQAMNNGQGYTYAQLHNIFRQAIANDILFVADGSHAPVADSEVARIAQGRSRGQEVVYPGLSEAARLALRPS